MSRAARAPRAPRTGAASATAPIVAIVGRPNVGKSTLFNRIVGGRPAMVHDTPGLTRDRRYGDVDYFGHALRAIDTGGLDPDAEREVIGAGIHRQAERAIDEAAALLLVVDVTAGLSPADVDVAARLRATGKPVFIAANKADHAGRDVGGGEFFRLGLGDPFPVSAAHGRGVDALLEAIVAKLEVPRTAEAPAPDDDDEARASVETRYRAPRRRGFDDHQPAADEQEARDRAIGVRRGPLRVAFIGRPNAGKSSLANRLLGEERSLVHDAAGTTTDPVDSPFSLGGRDYVLIDTAGIRRRAKVDADIERIAVSMAIGQIERADVVVLVIDAALGVAEQDARLAGMVVEAGRGLIIALNKSDLVRGDVVRAALKQSAEDNFHFLTWAPMHLLSAQRGDGVDRLMDLVDKVAKNRERRIATAELNRFFADVLEVTPPPLYRGRSIRVHYLTQGQIRPPTFLLWANDPVGLSPQYRRFITNQLRARYDFRGTPLRVVVKAKAQVERDAPPVPRKTATRAPSTRKPAARPSGKQTPRRAPRTGKAPRRRS
ncbi:MAG: ribosome biogenesis GTPase Der [Kofleriaceae bacterium]